jgi:hypothetical protein
MKKLLFLIALISIISCKDESPELPSIWKSSCQTFSKSGSGYSFDDCCGKIDFPALELSSGEAIILQGTYINHKNESSDASVRLNISKDAQTVNFTIEKEGTQSSYILEKDYSGPVCGCSCP